MNGPALRSTHWIMLRQAQTTSGQSLLKMIDDLHNNPVRRGLVERGLDWHWSSAAAFEGGASPLAVDPIPAEWLVDA